MRTWPFVVIAAAAAPAACADKKRVEADAAITSADLDGASALPDDASSVGVAVRLGEEDAGKRLVLQIAAASIVASISDRPEWPEDDAGAHRLGYLRNGAVVSAYDPPVLNEDCKEGWYELVDVPGFVCGKVATIDLNSPRVRLAPKQPVRDAGMPYRYGVNVSDGTPLYRRVLAADERKKYEPHLAAPKAEEGTESAAKDEEPPLVEEEHHEEAPRRRARGGRDSRSKNPFAGDAGRPTLKDLRGRGVLVRHMARGFTVALDKDFRAAGARWWRTTFGLAAPFDRIVVQSGQTKHTGNWFIGEAAVADLGEIGASPDPDAGAPAAGSVYFVTSSGSHRVELTDEGKGPKAGWGAELPRRSAVLLTGKEVAVAGVTYHQTSAGFWVRVPELRAARPAIPPDVGEHEKWIDIDLTRQQLVAFEGRRPVFATLVSTGRKNPYDKEHDFPTPTGTFRIREKHVTTTMDGDVAVDGPYSIEDVPWVMYFQGSYALHGAFWHDAFGNMRSHGCVNLAPEDARTLFGWADPQLPDGWHGVFAQAENSGSRVVVHEDATPKRRAAAAP